MDQQKIDVIETESLEARFRRAKKIRLARVQLGDLGGDEQVFAREAPRLARAASSATTWSP